MPPASPTATTFVSYSGAEYSATTWPCWAKSNAAATPPLPAPRTVTRIAGAYVGGGAGRGAAGPFAGWDPSLRVRRRQRERQRLAVRPRAQRVVGADRLLELERDRVIGHGRRVRQQVQRRRRRAAVVVCRARVGGVARPGLQRLRQAERAVDQVAGGHAARVGDAQRRVAGGRRHGRRRRREVVLRDAGGERAEGGRYAERERERRRHGAADRPA